MKIAVLGAGMVGSVIALDLAKKHEVTVFDNNQKNLKTFDTHFGISTQQADLWETDKYENLLLPFDLVACAVPGFMGYRSLEAIIKAGKNVVDISFSPENLLQLDGLAKAKNVTAIVDCGVAPGMSNLILGYCNSIMEVESFHCMAGGLPKHPEPPFLYKAPFSPIDVIEEYTRPARIMRNGKEITLPALSEMETVHFEQTGPLDCFNTDGLRSLLLTMQHIPDMAEKTLRYPGHIGLIEKLQSAGFFSEEEISINGKNIRPIDLTAKLLISQWKLNPEDPEFTIMRIDVNGNENGAAKTKSWFLYDERDENGISSMSRTTAYTCTAAVNMVAEGLFNKKGVFPPELMGDDKRCFEFIMNYLRERGVNYEFSEKLQPKN